MLRHSLNRTLAALAFCLCIVSCKEKEISLSLSDPLSLALGVQWGVVTSPYTSFFLNPDYSSAVTGYCRAGQVMMVDGKHLTTNPDSDKKNVTMFWYHFEQGWLPQSAVALFDNKLRAQDYALSHKFE